MSSTPPKVEMCRHGLAPKNCIVCENEAKGIETEMVGAERQKVLIMIPSLDGRIHAKLVQNIFPQITNQNDFAILVGVRPIAKARNHMVEEFLKTDATHLWMIDDDTVPPKDALAKLLALDVPIATGITPTIQGKSRIYNIFKETKDGLEAYRYDHPLPDNDRMIVAAVGASCILIKREVFEKIGDSPWFADVWDQQGQYCSEDIMFCNFAKAEGYTIFAHPKVICEHARYVLL